MRRWPSPQRCACSRPSMRSAAPTPMLLGCAPACATSAGQWSCCSGCAGGDAAGPPHPRRQRAHAMGAALLTRGRGACDGSQRRCSVRSMRCRCGCCRARGAREALGRCRAWARPRWADLRRLPRSGLARRFGTAMLDELDRAYGRAARSARADRAAGALRQPPRAVRPADSTAQVLHAASCCWRACGWLAAQACLRCAASRWRWHTSRAGAASRRSHRRRCWRWRWPSPRVTRRTCRAAARAAGGKAAARATLELQLSAHEIAPGEVPSGESVPERGQQAQGPGAAGRAAAGAARCRARADAATGARPPP